MAKPLDTDLKFKHLEYHTLDGKKNKSKEIHFHDVVLDDIIEIQANLKYETHILSRANLPVSFVEFIHFRSGGVTTRIVPGTGTRESVQIATWTIGWTDGTSEYLTEYEFKTGVILRSYVQERDSDTFPTHFHPQSKTKKVKP